jgi:hypothetical protein
MDMEISVAIVSKHCTEWELIHRQLIDDGRFQVRTYLTPAQVEQGLKQNIFDIVVVRMDVFQETHLTMVEKLRQKMPQPLLVFVAAEVALNARFLLRGRNLRAALLDSGHDTRNFAAVLWQVWNSPNLATRVHPRTARQDEVHLLNLDGTEWHGTFRDFGKMGAQIAVKSSLRNGDRVLMSYKSSSQDRLLRVESVVVWAQPEAIGLQFLAVVS